jgi:hypothetical protein
MRKVKNKAATLGAVIRFPDRYVLVLNDQHVAKWFAVGYTIMDIG